MTELQATTDTDDLVRQDLPDDVPDRHAGTRRLLDLWHRKRGARTMPARADFCPTEMKDLLPDMALFDVESAPRRYRVRLFGTGLALRSGLDLTGRYLDDIAGSAAVVERCDLLVGHRRPSFRRDIALSWSERFWHRYDLLGLPLAADGETVDMLMFLLSFD